MTTPSIVSEKPQVTFTPLYYDPRQMTVEEALQEIEAREVLFVKNIEESLRALQAEGVELAATVDAATLRRLELRGYFFDFYTGRVGRRL